MKQHIRRIASCVLTLALFLTLCPMIGSGSSGFDTQLGMERVGTDLPLPDFMEGNLSPTQPVVDQADRSVAVDPQYLLAPEEPPQLTGSLTISLRISGISYPGSSAQGI